MSDLQVDIANLEARLPDLLHASNDLTPLFHSDFKGPFKWRVVKALNDHLVIIAFPSGLKLMIDLSFPIIWARSGEAWGLNTWEDFTHLLKEDSMELEQDLDDILELIHIYKHPRNVLHSIDDVKREMIPDRNHHLVEKYRAIVVSPQIISTTDYKQAVFWTVDYQTGALEEGKITQKDSLFQIDFRTEIENLTLTGYP